MAEAEDSETSELFRGGGIIRSPKASPFLAAAGYVEKLGVC